MTNPTELPPLPEPLTQGDWGYNEIFGPDQMQDYARAAIEADRLRASYASTPEWLPIETAPKDGTSVLVVCDAALRPSPAVAHWSDTDGRGWLGGSASDWLKDVDERLGCFPHPTRWAPIGSLAAPTPQALPNAAPVEAVLGEPVAKLQAIGWAAFDARENRMRTRCETRERIDAYIHQQHQSRDDITLYARPIFAGERS